jgi:molybdate transport system substrate-binding protein
VDFYPAVLANVVSNETDVRQAVTKVELGEADAGMVYFSDSVAAPELERILIPEQFNIVASYPVTVLANSPKPDLAKLFISYILSPEGQATLEKWGFTPER